jgi:COP9 signalosome complex subunit 5
MAASLTAWEQVNAVKPASGDSADALFSWSADKMKAMYAEKPWKQAPKYFNSVKISALAVLKMAMHAKTGQGKKGLISSDANNWVEVMGLLQGYFYENTFVVTDSFGVPVEASEVECAMTDRSIQHMLAHISYGERCGRAEGCVGWYHSHPGLTCFLSGIDVNTQTLNQSMYDPWFAMVIDPVRTISTGKVEMRAFRTFPQNYTPDSADLGFDCSTVPEDKIKELGVHMKRYYELPVTIFRSSNDAVQLELLFSRYGMKALSTTPTVTNREFSDRELANAAQKIEAAASEAPIQSSGVKQGATVEQRQQQQRTKKEEAAFLVNAASTRAIEAIMLHTIKEGLFS